MMLLALFAVAVAPQPAVIKVDPAVAEIRHWEGFGCSLSWWGVFTEKWPEAARREACRRLFGRGDDCLALDVVRYNAGGTSPASDARRFRPGGKVQVTLDADGSFHPERDSGQLACLRESKRQGARVFEMFVNAPPHWMLRNGDTHGGDDGGENLRPEREEEYARWLVAVARKVEAAAGVRFASIAPFNEPSAWWWRAGQDGQEGCRILPPAQARVLRELKAELDRVRSRTIIACSDENEPQTGYHTLQWLTDPNDGRLDHRTIGRVNVHAYSGWEWQERLRDLASDRGIARLWMSEVSHREWEQAGYAPHDMRSALPQTRSVVNDLKRLRPNAWVFWQAVEPLQFCVWYRFTYGLLQAAADAPVDWSGRTFEPGQFVVSKAFWAIMQFSRFIRPAYRFIETSDQWTVAALSPNGKRLVIVAHHDERTPRPITLDLSRFHLTRDSVRAWRTMDDADGIEWNCRPLPPIGVTDGALQDTLPPRSVTTYVADGVGSAPVKLSGLASCLSPLASVAVRR